MAPSDDYLTSGFQEDQRELERTRALVKEVGDMFGKLVVQGQWPYDVKHRREVAPDPNYSQSTNAMILFALMAASHKTAYPCPLVPAGSEGEGIEFKEESGKAFRTVWSKLVEKTEEWIQKTAFKPISCGQGESEAQMQEREPSRPAPVVAQQDGVRRHVSWSGSFGYDDPFTLTWLLEIVRSDPFSGATTEEVNEALQARAKEVSKALQARAFERVERLFAFRPSATHQGTKDENDQNDQALAENDRLDPVLLEWDDPRYENENLQKRLRRTSLDHAFPVLRYIHLYHSLTEGRKDDPKTITTSRVHRYMQGRLHEQLSKSEIQDGEFDPPELVFALEGLLLFDPDSVGRALLDRVFHVIAESQVRNPYWRPVKPFVTTPQGHVLFPLSIETANSLLRCCGLIDKDQINAESFSRNIELFKRYAEWLRTRLKRGKVQISSHELVDFVGWHSEHVHLHEGIHLWETSHVLLFLVHYASMLDQHIARRTLAAANLTMTRPWKNDQEYWHTDYWQEENRQIGEPLAGLEANSQFRIYQYTGHHFIAPRPSPVHAKQEVEKPDKVEVPKPAKQVKYSMLLYGPPGTGKTAFAKEICKALRWDLITVTPSDFIRGGESEVEARAKMIFEVLSAQSNVVILFDEIDRMILDRDSELYGRQSDIFQFMTPSMLTKLKDLRDKEQVVFLIATNYAERIDAAAKRPGRLDVHGLLTPPDYAGRMKILKQLLKKQLGKDSPDLETQLQVAAKDRRMRLMVYDEIKNIFDAAVEALDEGERQDPAKIIDKLQKKTQEAGPSAISLASYESRFKNEKIPQKPRDEFLLLLHLCLEEEGRLDQKEEALVDQVLQNLLSARSDNWSGKGVDEEKAKKDKWSGMGADEKKEKVRKFLADELRNDKKLVKQILNSYFKDKG